MAELIEYLLGNKIDLLGFKMKENFHILKINQISKSRHFSQWECFFCL